MAPIPKRGTVAVTGAAGFLGGWTVVLAEQLGVPQWLGLIAAATAATALRLLAMVFDWKIPAWRAQA